MNTLSPHAPNGKASPQHYVYTLSYPESMGGSVFYVGKGTGKRISKHERETRNGGQSYKCNTIRKIWNNGEQIQKKKLAYFETHEEACMYEIALIFFLPDLTNLTDGGEGTTGIRYSDETRSRMSTTARNRSEETRHKLSVALTGRKHSPETRDKLSSARKKRVTTDETRNKMSATMKGRPGKPHSTETRQKISEVQIGHKQSPETVQKRVAKNKGKKRTEEHCARQSERQKGRVGVSPSPETRQKLSEAMKRYRAQGKERG